MALLGIRPGRQPLGRRPAAERSMAARRVAAWPDWLWHWAGAAWLLLASTLALAQPLQPVPALNARVMDPVGLLSSTERQQLEDKLAAFESQAGPQIVLLLVATTQPEDIAAYAQRVGETWKIGRREVGDGLLLVVARDDRKLWIAPAKALEGAVPDLAARQIIRDHISPAFKQGQYAAGLNAGVDQLIGRIKGENLPAPPAGGGVQGGLTPGLDLGLEELAIFFFVAVPIIGAVFTSMLGRRLGSLVASGATGGIAWMLSSSLFIAVAAGVVALVLVGLMGIGAAGRRAARHGGFGRSGPPVIFGGGGGGWSSGGGGGGGFSSGGGGDFGGGGAGGDW